MCDECCLLSVAGCPTTWDDIRCWNHAEVGQVVSVSCANVSQLFANNQGKYKKIKCRMLLLYFMYVVYFLRGSLLYYLILFYAYGS